MEILKGNLKIGTTLHIREPIRKEAAGFEEFLEIKEIVRKGTSVNGYGVVEKDSYLVEGEHIDKFETVNGSPRYVRAILPVGKKFHEIEINEAR